MLTSSRVPYDLTVAPLTPLITAREIPLSRCEPCSVRFPVCSVDDLTVHGLGTAIHRAINLTLELQEQSSHCLHLSVFTSTVQLVDDLEPVDDVCEDMVISVFMFDDHYHSTCLIPDTRA